MLSFFRGHYALHDHRKKWRTRNPHNHTTAVRLFNIDHVTVGNYTYGELNILDFNENVKLEIGHFCSIASNVIFVLNADHNMQTISTYPFKVKCIKSLRHEAVSKGDIVIDSDVWIGTGAIILSGVHIGQGAVIAAGAVVTKDIPPYAIAGGVPAKIIRYRFENDIIQKLMSIDYGKLTSKQVAENIDLLYQPISADNIDYIIHTVFQKN